MRSRFLAELTNPEVEEYFQSGGRTALIPTGCTEMHGPHQPIGSDTIQARGFALQLAEKANALVLPDIAYTWAGSTDGFAGTISVPPELVQQLATAVAVQAWKNGFRRIAFISCHGGNNAVLNLVIRRLFELHGIPAAHINPAHPLTERSKEIAEKEFGQGSEASRVLASLHILGTPDLYREEDMQAEDHAPPLPKELQDFPFPMGYFMQDSRQHACPSPLVSKKLGLEFYAELTSALVAHIEAIDQYLETVEGQDNQGWQKASAG